jgi:hypothetical protein
MLTIMCPDGQSLTVDLRLSDGDVSLIHDYLAAFGSLTAAPGFSRAPQYAEYARDPEVGTVFRWKPMLTPDEKDLLMYRLRPLILQEEPFSFYNVANILGKGVSDRRVRRFLKSERSRFSGEYWRKMWQISCDETLLNSEEMFRKWLNSAEYHRDPDKRREVEELIRQSVPGLFQWVQTTMTFEKVEAVGNVAALARVVVGLNDSLVIGD